MLGVRAAAHPTIARIVGVLSPLESPTKVPRWFCVSRFSFAQPAFLCFSAGCSKDPAVACGQEKGLLSIATSHRSLCFTHVCSAHFAVPPLSLFSRVSLRSRQMPWYCATPLRTDHHKIHTLAMVSSWTSSRIAPAQRLTRRQGRRVAVHTRASRIIPPKTKIFEKNKGLTNAITV